MKKKSKSKINTFGKGVVLSYSQIFFSTNFKFSFLLILVSFFDLQAGICGLIGVTLSNIFAIWLGFDRRNISQGYYGFNSLLICLGLGVYFLASVQLLLLLLLAAVFGLFVTIVLQGVLGKYYLPYLSLPFLIVFWTIMLASRKFTSLQLNEHGVFYLNELYKLGGTYTLKIFTYLDTISEPVFIKTYFLSLGAIFFQYHVLSGCLIAVGLLLYSRISFSLSVIGFCAAYIFYSILGVDFNSLSYSYIGFNYILSSIAIGGYFLIPSRVTYQWIILLVPLVAIISISFTFIIGIYQLSIYSLPFNLIVLTFLYMLKLRVNKNPLLTEVIVQQGTPEKNLYFYKNSEKRLKSNYIFPFKLPFWGEWTVSQAHNGAYTHKDDWRHAWDFVITGQNGKTFTNEGLNCKDFFAYNKNVLASADGVVEELVDGIADNEIGDINVNENWGNTIIIKHTDHLYSKLCHLKATTLKVRKGDFVKQGQIIAQCGNSGRSPEPHLHFQIQATPYIGSKTIEYPISHYLTKKEKKIDLKSFDIPKLKDIVSNIDENNLLTNAFHFIPGQTITFNFISTKKSKIEKNTLIFEIQTDALNYHYIYCRKTNSYAYFQNDGTLFYFTNFIGSRKSLLYYFYLTCFKVPQGFYKQLIIHDLFPVNHLYKGLLLAVQDFIAPFYIFLKASYTIQSKSIDDEFNPQNIVLNSTIETAIGSKKLRTIFASIDINEKGLHKFIIQDNTKKIEVQCVN